MKKTTKKNYSMRNIAMVLAVGAATSMMLSTVAPAFALSRDGYGLTARSFLAEVHQTVVAGDPKAILALIQQLRSMKVNSISLDGKNIALEELERLVADGSPEAVLRLGDMATLAQTQRARFFVDNVEVASVDQRTQTFPTSSFG